MSTTGKSAPARGVGVTALRSGTKVRAIDMFCGAGGSSWGAHQAGVELVAGFDLWDLAGKNHHLNFPDSEFFLGRLEDVDLATVKRKLGKIDLILASPECTNHSPAKGNKPRCEVSKDTAFQVVRFARELKPRWVVIENVVSMRRWSRYVEFKAELESLGYKLREQVLNAAQFAVAQGRRRLFLMCDLVRVPPLISVKSRKRKTVASILNMDSPYKWTPLKTPRRAAATLERAAKGIATLGSKQPFLLVYYGSDGAGGWQELSRPLRTITTVDRFALVRPTKGGHEMRMLQVPELQVAMGMNGLKLEHGSRRERIKMLGNAVCPPVMQSVIEHLRSEG
jgi:DNA (cytosine-5)-methyltransferase 1